MVLPSLDISPEWVSAIGASVVPILLGILAFRQSRIAANAERKRDERHRDDQVLGWATRVIAVFAELEFSCRRAVRPANIADMSSGIAMRASALIDEGRFYFPNVDVRGDRFVFNQSDGKRGGYRQRVLDDVVRLYFLAKAIQSNEDDCGPEAADVLWRARQRFVENIQTYTLATLSMRTPSNADAEAAGGGLSGAWREWA